MILPALSVYELDQAIADTNAKWDGIGQEIPRAVHHLEHKRSLIVKEFAGCCGERYMDGPYCKYVHVVCPAVARGCRMASLPEIQAVLNEVRNFEPLT